MNARHQRFTDASGRLADVALSCCAAFPRLATMRRTLAALLFAGVMSSADALDLVGPPGSGRFGTKVTVLPNGNIVVTDPDAASGVGAVYLFSPSGSLISTLTGTHPNDQVGNGGVTVLANGNYVIFSHNWYNGAAAKAGAVTWASATTGISGVVTADNSLVGSAIDDRVGYGRATVLSNGNYVVSSEYWDNGTAVNAGAATWGNGETGISGVVSESNSLVGAKVNDFVGRVTALSNGHYVVRSSNWDNGAIINAGAATWANGMEGISGLISVGNSLIGTAASDQVGQYVTALSNGHYVVRSPYWSNGNVTRAGAVTWANGATGISGPVSVDNSLVGTATDDFVGNGGATALSNGHYVVSSHRWANGAAIFAGAVTWGNGTTGTTGSVSVDNSLVGTAEFESIGYSVIALKTGHYVVRSPSWSNGTIANAGAVTWRNGTAASPGTISAGNSLVGTSIKDRVGLSNVTALSNGHYVVQSQYWSNGTVENAGAVTWGDGTKGISGPVSTSNSLVGTSTNDAVGRVIVLSNSHYVEYNPHWNNGAAVFAGAVTWVDGTTGTSAEVSTSNSLVGTMAVDEVGRGVTALSNGHFVVRSRMWAGGADVGAVTWVNGTTGTSGQVSMGNSLFGTTIGDQVGSGGITALSNGNYVVRSPNWDNGALTDSGAITLARGTAPFAATINAGNSVLGTTAEGGAHMVFDYDASRDQLVVGRPLDNIVTIFRLDALFQNGFE